jgi:DNA replication protein DnaC
VIDDLGAQYSTPWALEQIYLLVDSRYQHRRPIVATSNLNPEELAEQLSSFRQEGALPVGAERDPNQLGWRIVSRLIEICGDPLPLGEDRDLRREYRPAEQGEVA